MVAYTTTSHISLRVIVNENPVKFLVVTAAEDSLSYIEKALHRAFGKEIQVTKRRSFQEGCEALLAESFDMVVTSLDLPDNRGVTILNRFSLLSDRAPLVAVGQTSNLRAPSIRNAATDYINSVDCDAEEWVAVLEAAWERCLIRWRSRAPRVESAVNRFERVANKWGVANG